MILSLISATIVVLEVNGNEDVLRQLMSDGGFESVGEHMEPTFESALATINQMMLS